MLQLYGHGKVFIENVPEHLVERFCKHSENSSDWFFLIMPEYGRTVHQQMELRSFTKAEILQIGIQLLHQLEAIHLAGFVHGDLKPANIVIGQACSSQDQTKRVRIIDFGICSMYVKPNGTEYSEFDQFNFKGTLLFSSVHTMEKQHLSKRDDLISLVYLLLYLFKELPIPCRQVGTLKEDFDHILQIKKQLSIDDLCQGRRARTLKPFVEEVFSYKYNEKPYYNKLRHLLTSQLLDLEVLPSEDIFGRNKQLPVKCTLVPVTVSQKKLINKSEVENEDDGIPDEQEPSANAGNANQNRSENIKQRDKNPFSACKVN